MDCKARDLTGTKAFVGILILTAVLIVGQVVWPQGNPWLAFALLLSWAGFCGANAIRCRRLHCFFTAPIFFLGAMAILFHRLGFVRVSEFWLNWFVLGGAALALLAEIPFGKYIKQS